MGNNARAGALLRHGLPLARLRAAISTSAGALSPLRSKMLFGDQETRQIFTDAKAKLDQAAVDTRVRHRRCWRTASHKAVVL